MEIRIDSEKLLERAQGQQYLKEQFGFPDYYGENLDALYDLLTEITEKTEIYYAGNAHKKDGGQEAKRVLEILLYAAEENENISIREEE